MKFSLLAFLLLFTVQLKVAAQTKSVQEKLGYTKDTKLLIIHADDLGMAHSENEATITAMEKGAVNSASIMVPTPWFTEIAEYAVAHPAADFGLHLTLTSEWKYYKWGPLADAVPGLDNANGFLYASVDSVYQFASLKEVEKEVRQQIERAKQAGIDFTHFDSHMAAMWGRADYLKLLIDLGREYRVPVMLARTGPRSLANQNLLGYVTEKDVLVDGIFTATPTDFQNGMDKFYSGVLQSLKSGLNILIIHTAFDDKEMQAITVEHPGWGAAWRQADYDFFTSDACKKILKDQHIRLVTWRQVRDKLLR